MMYFFGGVLIVFFKDANTRAGHGGGGGESYSNCFELQKFSSNIFKMMHDIFCIYIPVFAWGQGMRRVPRAREGPSIASAGSAYSVAAIVGLSI